MAFKLLNVFLLVVWSFPKVIFILVGMVYYLLKLRQKTSPARRESMRFARLTHTPITNLAKITFTGNSVIRAFGYE